MKYLYFILGILTSAECVKFKYRDEGQTNTNIGDNEQDGGDNYLFDDETQITDDATTSAPKMGTTRTCSTKQDSGGTAAEGSFPIKVDASAVVDDAPKIVEDAPTITDDATKITDEAPKITDEAPKITDDAITIIDEGPTITDDDPAITDDVAPVAEIATTTTLAEITTPARPIRPVVTYDFSVWCKLQPIQFDCDGRGFTRTGFYYDSQMKRCVSTTYSTCANNFNRFKDSRGCMKVCRGYGSMDLLTENLEVLCRLQPEFGDCYNYFPMFYYDVNEKVCRGFSFSGCGGNTNRFHTLQQCNSSCADVIKYEPDKDVQ